ncbi:MAG: hypothetical protein KGI08_07115 [Thaumarchaeota archaeon]|nr:hypothetical protein [Nitrososphaerota archaeon]
MKRHYAKSGVCDNCRKEVKTQWANKNGLYDEKNRNDWLELCGKCHYIFDIEIHTVARAKRREAMWWREKPTLNPLLIEELKGTFIIYRDNRAEILERLRTYPWFIEE